MIRIETLVFGYMANNCYLVWAEGCAECVIIDAPMRGEDILSVARRLHLQPVAVLLTHGHFDHVGAAKYLSEQGIPVYMHRADFDLPHTGTLGKVFPSIPVDNFLNGDEVLSLAGMSIRVLATPGHSMGSVTFQIEDSLFVGDTVFAGTYGRTDLYGGSFEELADSIGMLCELSGDYTIYSGHGDTTTLSYERQYNDVFTDLQN